MTASIDETARRRFESAFAAGTVPRIEEFLPPPGDSRRAATLEELVLIELEMSWKCAAGNSSRIGEYLGRFPELDTPAILIRLAREEFLLRKHVGGQPSVEEYRAKHPELSTFVDESETLSSGPAPDKPPAAEGYEILGLVGRGGMGIVYEARELRLGRTVALKTARGGSHAADLKARFLTEARVAAALEHPGVVPVHELVTPPDGEPFYTMKLVRGRSLADAIADLHAMREAERGVARRRLLEAFLVVTRTMAFAHERGVIHRDLKPANIVLGELGETVILDWGLAKVIAEAEPAGPARSELQPGSPDLTLRGDVIGTPAYMSPEQAAGRIDEVDTLSDIFSLGAILYHILTGRHWTEAAGPDVFDFIRSVEPVRPSEIARVERPLEAICLRAMAKDRDDRYSRARLLADDVERHLAGETVSVYRERPTERLGRWTRRHRILVAAGGVAAALGLIGAVAGLELQNRAERKLDRANFEAERQDIAARAERRDIILRTVQAQNVRGSSELRSNRFSAAEQAFRGALADLPADESPELRTEIGRRHREAGQLAAFHRYWARAQKLALATDDIGYTPADDSVVAACESGLNRLGVLPDAEEWWRHLPDTDLGEEQRHALRTEAASALGMLAMWQTKRGVMREVTGRPLEAQSDYRATLAHLERIQTYVHADSRIRSKEHGSASADALALFCRLQLGEPPPARPLVLAPVDAADLYYLGVTHVFLESSRGYMETGKAASGLTKIFGGDTLVDKMMTRVGEFKRWGGLDFDTPQFTAQRHLRSAVAADPEHYLAHYWLGRCLRNSQNYSAAEQAFNNCVSLHPEFSAGYLGRASSLIIESYIVKNAQPPRLPAELRETALRGLRAAPESVRADPSVLFLESKCLRWMGREAEANETAYRAIEAELIQRRGIPPSWPSIAREMNAFVRGQVKASPGAMELRLNLAATCLALGQTAEAQREIDGVLVRAPQDPKALTLRGLLRLDRGEVREAQADFDSAAPPTALAAIGRAWAFEQRGDWDSALEEYRRSSPRDAAGAGPQHLQPLMGQVRVLSKLGRKPDALTAHDIVREIDPVAAETLK